MGLNKKKSNRYQSLARTHDPIKFFPVAFMAALILLNMAENQWSHIACPVFENTQSNPLRICQ